MQRELAGLAVIVGLLLNSGGALAAPADAEARYQALLADAKAGDKPVDWQALRFAYADRPSFSVFGGTRDDAHRKMSAALSSGDFAGALALAKSVMNSNFVDAGAHLVAAIANRRLGHEDVAGREDEITVGLLKSIETGDGKTATTAFTVINVDEEYTLMNALRLKVSKQALISQGGHSYDVLDTVSADGHKQSFYFLIDRVLAAEAAVFAPKH